MLKSVLPLSFIIASRFLGLFIVLPVLSLYALNLRGANEFLVGLIVGVYAISQMIFQVPFGALSDRIGRKKTLTIGLLVFIIGSIICALTSDIFTMLFGRFLQGVGAIGAVATAMISDYITEEKRSKAMAIMGAFIGLSFTLSMVLGPLLAKDYGLSSLFYFSAALSLLCVVLLYTVVPKEIKKRLKLNRDKMIDGIRTISMLSDQMKITFTKDSITFESIIEDNSEAKTTIEYQTGLEDEIFIGIKNRYLLDFLTSIEDDDFELGFNDSNLAFIVSSKELTTVIMPINI